MAVFSWYQGDPFSYEMDEDPFYDAISDVSSDISNFVANTRSVALEETYGWGTSYFHWYDDWARAQTKAPENVPGMMLLMMGIPLSFVPFVALTIWTAPAVFLSGVFRYFD